ncbi:hypothetical protein FHX74_001728 [Friedmanniella endophytica]|uniref:Uncharacterized protein n=1 Tax=Microlunatus kandeliicorticis TaxID=1759536 RepID=A0A7W3IRV9_9ACTN|nr:hypothetical protein [Microlunatus kandeliicorticis]MBA8794123.1 hypothetical protein [Microlunatus kandeliicorticis]
MTTSTPIAPEDSFGLWYRFSAPLVISLLSVIGPAQLEDHQDPRRQAEADYIRRANLHRARQGKGPLRKNPFHFGRSIDPLVVALVAGPLALVVLLAWAVASKF